MADEPMADEPMADERLAEIRRMISRAEVSMMASSDIAMRDLLAEVERLQTENQRLTEERERWAITAVNGYETVADRSVTLAAAMAIVRDVATEDTLAYEGDAGDDYRCVFCGGHFDWRDGYEHTVPTREQMDDIPHALVHTSDCPVTKARALLTQE